MTALAAIIAWVADHWRGALRVLSALVLVACGARLQACVDREQIADDAAERAALRTLADTYAGQQAGWRQVLKELRAVNESVVEENHRLTLSQAEGQRAAREEAAANARLTARNADLLAELDRRPIADDCADAMWDLLEVVAAVEQGRTP